MCPDLLCDCKQLTLYRRFCTHKPKVRRQKGDKNWPVKRDKPHKVIQTRKAAVKLLDIIMEVELKMVNLQQISFLMQIKQHKVDENGKRGKRKEVGIYTTTLSMS